MNTKILPRAVRICLLFAVSALASAHATTPQIEAGDPLVVDAASGLNLRPRPNSGLVGVIPDGTTIYATGEPQSHLSGPRSNTRRDWVPVKFRNESGDWIEGWVMLRFTDQTAQPAVHSTSGVSPATEPAVVISQSQAVPEEGAETSMEMKVSVRSSARLRSGPGTSTTVLDSFANDTRVNVIGPPNGNWIPVQRVGTDERGWIHSSLLQATGALNPLEISHQNFTPVQQTTERISSYADQVAGENQDGEREVEDATTVEGAFGAMRYDPVASGGQCMLRQITTDAQARALLSFYNVRAPGATEIERRNLANGLFQASALYGGRFEPLVGLTFQFSSRSGFSRYLAGSKTIDLNRCNKSGGNCGANANINVARLMHEAGHGFGHALFSGTQSYYDKFSADVRGCYPTGYSNDNLVENTAEVFSAFLTYPTRLSRGSAACQRAYRFLSTEVFKGNGTYASCDTQQRQLLAAEIQGTTGPNGAVLTSFENVFSPRTRAAENMSVPVVAPADDSAVSAVREI